MNKRVLFIGSKESGLGVLKTITKIKPESLVGCITVDDSLDTRSVLNEFEIFCELSNIPLDVLSGNCNLYDSLIKYTPELCIVMGWYHIISDDILNMVKNGFIGIHNSILPAHRGFAPVVWSIIAGEDTTGFSVFSLSSGMDTGKIWYQEKVTIEQNDYISDVFEKIDKGITLFFNNHYLDLLYGRITPCSQNINGISYGARRTVNDGLICWNNNNTDVYNHIRAQSHPYSGAFTRYNELKIIIWRAELFQHRIQGMPGQVFFLEDDSIIVICGNDTGIVLKDVAIDNKIINIRNLVKNLNDRFF